jgi:hypothetical protein
MRFKIHKIFNFVWDGEESPLHWKESILVTIYKKGGKHILY